MKAFPINNFQDSPLEKPNTLKEPTMQHQRTYPANRLASSANSKINNFPAWLARAVAAVMLLHALLLVPAADAQQSFIRFTFTQNRITVPVGPGATNTTTITNFVNLGNGCTNAIFDVSGLPAGAGYVFTDTNGVPLNPAEITSDTNVWLTVFTTNIAEGVYLFNLDAGGEDTNGLPVTNSLPLLLQAAHVWNGTLNTSNAWSTAVSWLNGSPGATSDVVFGDTGAQTNGFAGPNQSGIPFTNSVVNATTTISSLRFAQSGSTNFSSLATNPQPIYHHIQILPGNTLTVSGPNGFSILPDYYTVDDQDIRAMNVTIDGAGAKLVVSNLNAFVATFSDSSLIPTLNMSNLDTFIAKVDRIGIADYQLYPQYRALNTAINVGRDTNRYDPHPAQMSANVYMAKTNILFSAYIDPSNYTNEMSRGYGFTLYNDETHGIGSSANQSFVLGLSNIFLMDGICLYGANGNASTTTGTRFGAPSSFAVFRNTNGTSRMSVFTVSDDGGTNEAQSNMKGVVDFSAGSVDILADRFYLSRDRELIGTNSTPNIQATVTFGKGNIDVNTAVLGFQEHTKPDWTLIGGGGAYLNYCRGSLTVTSNGVFKVNGNLTLGYTTDTNNVNDAEQYNTWGQITILSNSTVQVSNIICDGNLNYYDFSNKRQNQITIGSAGTLIVSNSIGGNNYNGTDLNTVFNPGLPGLPLDTLSMAPASTLTLFVTPGKTNVFVRTLLSTGNSQPGIIKIASLPAFPVYPTNISLISYSSATPVLAADMSAIGGTVQGYILNNVANSTIDLFLTTNAPRQLVWTGHQNNNWDLSSTNWAPFGGGAPTTFNLGDVAIFDDSSSVTNINITDTVVPNQQTNGVIITNSVNLYTFTAAGGSVAGTAKIIKQGSNLVAFNAAEAGPMFVTAGEVDAGSGGILGTTIVYSNAVLKVLTGGAANGVIATNSPINVQSGGAINGAVTLVGGSLVNDGSITVPSGGTFFSLANNAVATNNADGTITINGVNSSLVGEVSAGCVMANFGNVSLASSRLQIDGTFFGTGQVFDSIDSPTSSAFGRLQMGNTATALMSPGSTPTNSIGNFTAGVRLDLSGNNAQNNAGKLLVEVDTVHNTYDTITAARWNNIGCIWQMTNLNGTFQSGQTFQVLVNENGVALSNGVDTAGIYPLMQPTIPGPGLQWNLSGIQPLGTVSVTNSTMVWDGSGTASWDTNGSTSNWKNGNVYADNQGTIFDDTASGLTTVTLNTPVAPAGINVVSVTNVIGTTTNIIITTNTPAFSPGIVVSNAAKDYTFIASAQTNRITGMTSIYKTGSGTLYLLTSNDFTGGMIVDGGGAVAITNVSALGNSPATRPAYDQIMMDNATLKYYGPNTNQTLQRPFTFNAEGATFEVSSNGMLLILSPANSGILAGAGALIKTGGGTLVLSQSADNYAGGTVVSNGTLRLTAAAAGSGPLTFSNNTSLQITNAFTLTNAVSLPVSAVSIALQGTATNVVSGSWSGGSATITGTNAARLLVFNNDLTGVAGTISFSNSISAFRFNNGTSSSPCLGSASATFDLGNGSALLYNITKTNLTYDLGALAGGPNTTLAGSSTNSGGTTTTYRIGANGANSTFAGVISNGVDVVSVVKVGAGQLLLNGNSIYTGSTTVSNGILGGTGSIASPLTVAAAGTLSPGAPMGTFTVSNSAILNGTVLIQLNNANAPNSGTLSVTGTLTGGGALTVTNIGPDIPNGTRFQLFNKAVTGFTAATLPSSNPANTSSYSWQTNIAVDGSITLISGGTTAVNTNPTNITFNVSGHTLTMTWPGDHQGWQLLSNPVSLTATGQWYPMSGSILVTNESVTVDPTKTNVFFRMQYPPVP